MSELYAPQVAVLSNGLQLVSVERPHSKTFAASLAMRVGFVDDPADLPGMAHFAEHLAFVGRNKSLAESLTANGADIDAETTSRETTFHISGHVDQLDDAIRLIANVLQWEAPSAAEFEMERKIIRHEIGRYGGKWRAEPLQTFYAQVLGEPHRYSSERHQLKSLKKMTLEALGAFQRTYYRPEHARLALVTPLPQTAQIAAVERHLLAGTADSHTSPRPRKAQFQPGIVKISPNGSLQADITSAHVVRSSSPATRVSAEIVFYLLGDGPHSELFRQLRSERSLAYAVWASNAGYLGLTFSSCHATVPRSSILEALRLILERQAAIVDQGLSEQQLGEAKNRWRRYHEMSVDHPNGLARFLAFEALRPPEDQFSGVCGYLDTLNVLSLDEVNCHARELLSPRNRSIYISGALGPIARWRIRRLVREFTGH